MNPVQEVSAAAARVENGFSTREREAAEMNGTDFWQNARQRKQENKIMEEVNGVE